MDYNRLLYPSSPIDEIRRQSNLDDVYSAAKLKYRPSVQEEVERLTSERVNSRAPGPGGAALSPDQWRAYFGGVVPQQRAAQAEQQRFDATRTPLNRLLSTDAFAVSAPIRMLTGGKYGASNLLEMFPSLQALAPAVAKGETDFARANEGALETAAQAGESAMALPGLQELGAVEGGVAGTLKSMRNTKPANVLNRLLPTADDASRTMNIFAGPKAATADHAALARAQEMEAAGTHPDEIWRTTGWGRGADNKWRWEVDDSESGLSTAANEVFSKGEIKQRAVSDELYHNSMDNTFNHNSMYDAYPSLRNIETKLHSSSFGDSGGSAHGDSIDIYSSDPNKARSLTLHENQHPIQSYEHFARGASPDNIHKILGKPKHSYQTVENAEELSELAKRYGGFDKYINATVGGYEGYTLEEKELARNTNELNLEIARHNTVGFGAEEAYRKMAGEVEARNVQHRMDWTADERRATPPWNTEDVPRDKQIVHFGDNGAVEGGIAGTLKAMRNTRTANALNRLLPTVDDASRTMNIFAGPKATAADHVAQSMEKAGELGKTEIFETGKPVSFDYIRNTEKAPQFGSQYGQDIEPAGRYLSHKAHSVDMSQMPKTWETGNVSFDNPLVLNFGGNYGDKTNWKNVVSKAFGNKTGKDLSKAIFDAGYDGIVTVDKYGASEIVDLKHHKQK